MVNYRRVRSPGAVYFFTVTLRDRRSDLLVREINGLRDAWRAARSRVPHTIVASVILPEHLHAILRMHDDVADYPRFWRDLKRGFTCALPERQTSSPWQPRYWEHVIRDENDLRGHIDYVHINPMKHDLVSRVVEWPHSSFHRYVREKKVPADWGGTVDESWRCGERCPRRASRPGLHPHKPS